MTNRKKTKQKKNKPDAIDIVVQGNAVDSTLVAGNNNIINSSVTYFVYNLYQSVGSDELSFDEFQEVLTRYLEWILKEYSSVRLYGPLRGPKGLSMITSRPIRHLGDIFVPIKMRRTDIMAKEDLSDIAEIDDPILRAKNYLALIADRRRKGQNIEIKNLLTLNDKIAIVGGAGSGKSTMLAFIAMALAEQALGKSTPLIDFPDHSKPLVPILVPLRNYWEYLRLCSQSPQLRLANPLVGTVAGFINWHLNQRSPITQDISLRLMKKGGCLLLLDGLDEVANRDDRMHVRQQIENLATDFPGNSIVVTVRESGYREDSLFGDDYVRLDLQNFEQHQIDDLVRKWCIQLYPGEEAEHAKELIASIRNMNSRKSNLGLPPIIDTPLLVSIVVGVSWRETELPRERARLYENAVEILLRSLYLKDELSVKELISWGGAWDEQREWLQNLAYYMHSGGVSKASIAEAEIRAVLSKSIENESIERFIEAVRYRGGLLEERAGLFQFLHLTFQEFLVARLFAKWRQAGLDELRKHIKENWWREVLLLIYGFARIDYSPFANQYLEWLSSIDDDWGAKVSGLELACAAIIDNETTNTKISERQSNKLAAALFDQSNNASPDLLARAGDTLGQAGDPRFDPNNYFLPKDENWGFVEITQGPFWMGDNEDITSGNDKINIYCEIYLPTFFISRYPITVAQFRAFVHDSGYQTERTEISLGNLSNRPVTWVSWYDAIAYTDWLTKKMKHSDFLFPAAELIKYSNHKVTLPSEAEWEKAARGTDGRIYPWGNIFSEYNSNTSETKIRSASAVGIFSKGCSPYGIMDMSGNIWEWTRSIWGNDFYEPDYKYPYICGDGRESLDPRNDVLRMLRGGSHDLSFLSAKSYHRRQDIPNTMSWDIGFRIVISKAD